MDAQTYPRNSSLYIVTVAPVTVPSPPEQVSQITDLSTCWAINSLGALATGALINW